MSICRAKQALVVVDEEGGLRTIQAGDLVDTATLFDPIEAVDVAPEPNPVDRRAAVTGKAWGKRAD